MDVHQQQDSTSDAASSEASSTTLPTAVVIGAGPAGLSVSLGLSRCGWQVILIEKYNSFEIRGASFGMASNGRKALEELCPGSVQHGMVEAGRAIELKESKGLMLPWWMMRDALLERVRDTENIDLRMGLSVDEIVDEPQENSVQVRFTNGETIEGDLVIGADGVHSAVREILRLPANELTGSKVFRGTVLVEKTIGTKDERKIDKTVGTQGTPLLEPLLEKGLVPISATYPKIHFFVLNFHPHIPGRLCWVFSSSDPDFDPHKKSIVSLVQEHESDTDKHDIILAILAASLEDSFSSFTETKVTDFSDETLSRFHGRWGGKGRVTLIGDAAHAMRPTDGQGGNMAFEDAAVLCRLLGTESARSAAGATNGSMADLLDEFEKMRLPRVKKMHDNQRLRYEARMSGEKVGPWSSEFQEWARNGV